jgi:hypothetical protein
MALITLDPGNRDIKKVTGNIFVIAILGALGLLAWAYLLPFLNGIVWGTLELAIGVVAGALLFFILSSGKFWRSLKYLGEFTGQFLLGWLIEMNPFGILQYRLDQTAEAIKDMLKYKAKLEGKAAELKEKIDANDKELNIAIQSKNILQAKSSLTDNESDNLEMALGTITSNTEYIEGIKPVYNDILRLLDYTSRGYRTASLELEKSKKDLSKKRDLYETVTTASATVKKVWKALLGDDNLNSDADKAIEALRKDIGAKIGAIKTGIKATSTFMDGKDLENAAKLKATLTKLNDVDLTQQNYSDTLNDSATRIELGSMTGGANKYASEFLKIGVKAGDKK